MNNIALQVPWWLWVGLGVFLGGILFNRRFRAEMDCLLAYMMGMRAKPSKKRGNDKC